MLCVVRIDWKRLPVFLIGSTVLMEFYLIRFLGHLYSLLKVRYLEEEHEQLIRELARRNQSAEKWRSIGTLDSLTGIFSRRYIMEHTAALLQADTQFSLVFIDLDCLKQINDRQGTSCRRPLSYTICKSITVMSARLGYICKGGR